MKMRGGIVVFIIQMSRLACCIYFLDENSGKGKPLRTPCARILVGECKWKMLTTVFRVPMVKILTQQYCLGSSRLFWGVFCFWITKVFFLWKTFVPIPALGPPSEGIFFWCSQPDQFRRRGPGQNLRPVGRPKQKIRSKHLECKQSFRYCPSRPAWFRRRCNNVPLHLQPNPTTLLPSYLEKFPARWEVEEYSNH